MPIEYAIKFWNYLLEDGNKLWAIGSSALVFFADWRRNRISKRKLDRALILSYLDITYEQAVLHYVSSSEDRDVNNIRTASIVMSCKKLTDKLSDMSLSKKCGLQIIAFRKAVTDGNFDDSERQPISYNSPRIKSIIDSRDKLKSKFFSCTKGWLWGFF